MLEREQLIEHMRTTAYKPLTVQELGDEFGVESADDFRALVKLLNQMEEQGDVVRTRTNRYGVPERMNLVVGRLQMKARGFGFVVPESSDESDLYISASDLNSAMHGDRVMARVEHVASGKREGKVIRILDRANAQVVGKITLWRDHAFVSPLDKRFTQDIFIPMDASADAHDGYVVVVEITNFPTPTRGPEGKVIEILGHPDAPGVDILGVVRKYGLPTEFPDAVLADAEAISLELTEEDYVDRRDLRDETIVTIDGEDAKDLDDAVHVKRLENGNYLLGVHIADVGHYVKEGSKLDKEAFRRGTSVYLVDRVIPMLPQRLSNNICSLNPHIDRLTLSCQMEITPSGETVDHDIFASVIRTTERMTYTSVRKILAEENEEEINRYRTLVPTFQMMASLAGILRGRRMGRGAIDFDFEEVKVVVDELGHPTAIEPRQRSIAERLIEEFMLAANETIAEHFEHLGVPFVYRVHEPPDIEKMLDFNEFVHNFGYHVKGVTNKIHPHALQSVLERVKGTREERVISSLMLRSMRQARYAPQSLGHFGLSADYYTHFTSPIRRYPDLLIHRIIREIITKGLNPNREDKLRDLVQEASIQSSERERIAQDAERETDQLKMVEYMLDHVGEEYDGLISGVTQFGLFVQLNNGVEGLIHISYLTDDYYVLNERQMALVGERTRRVFRLGDPVRVEVSGASKENLTIDFELVSHHREATLVSTARGDAIVYDEDLSPADRRRQIAARVGRADVRSSGRREGKVTGRSDRASGSSNRRSRDASRDGSRSVSRQGGSQTTDRNNAGWQGTADGERRLTGKPGKRRSAGGGGRTRTKADRNAGGKKGGYSSFVKGGVNAGKKSRTSGKRKSP